MNLLFWKGDGRGVGSLERVFGSFDRLCLWGLAVCGLGMWFVGVWAEVEF